MSASAYTYIECVDTSVHIGMCMYMPAGEQMVVPFIGRLGPRLVTEAPGAVPLCIWARRVGERERERERESDARNS
jgi:hypothetical protein